LFQFREKVRPGSFMFAWNNNKSQGTIDFSPSIAEAVISSPSYFDWRWHASTITRGKQ
jgi:hypothetical protein